MDATKQTLSSDRGHTNLKAESNLAGSGLIPMMNGKGWEFHQ